MHAIDYSHKITPIWVIFRKFCKKISVKIHVKNPENYETTQYFCGAIDFLEPRKHAQNVRHGP
jgi:hypothetical protein